MNIPNRLTMTRLALIPVFIVLVFLEVGGFARINDFIAVVVFGFASFTDFLDGYLARKWNMVTDFGKLIDSAADKLLCCSALILLIYIFAVVCTDLFAPAAMFAMIICLTVFAVVIICRELFMTAFRSLAASRNVIIAADMPGKIKAAAQMFGIVIILIAPDLAAFGLTLAAQIVFIAGFSLLALSVLMAIISFVLYLVKYPDVFTDKPVVKAEIQSDKNDDCE